jgi:hypothetical protein
LNKTIIPADARVVGIIGSLLGMHLTGETITKEDIDTLAAALEVLEYQIEKAGEVRNA